MARARKPRDPFKGLPDEFRAEIDGSDVDQINAKVAELAKEEARNLTAKAEDGDLREKKEAVKFAAEGYRESTKGYRLRIKYILSVLQGRGKA